MSDELRKIIENAVPPPLEKWFPRWAQYLVFWVVTAVIATWFLMTGLVYGALVVGGPLLLLAATRWRGLGRVHRWLLVFAATMSLVPAFFLGKYESSDETPSGLVLVGFLIFLLWVTAYPVMLDRLDERFHISTLYRDDAGVTRLPGHVRNRYAMFRLLLVKSWIATICMLVADSSLVAVLCLVALLVRNRAIAVIAGIACLLAAVVSFDGGEVSLTFNVIDIFAGVVSALQWYDASRNPLWEREKS